MFGAIKFKETEHTVRSALVVILAEIVATAMLMFLGCLGGVGGFKGQDAPTGQGAVVFGMTVCSLVQMLGHVSGAHMNPVVTLAAWLWGSISLPLGILYFIAQMIGALAGFEILTIVTPDELLYWGPNHNGTQFCTTTPAPGLTTTQAFIGEFIVTAMLILLCCGCWDKRNQTLQDGVAIKFGILVAAISLAQGPFTGASMNPARTFAPSIILNSWDRHWIYWAAPLSAGAVVPIVYKTIFSPPPAKEEVLPTSTSQFDTIAISKKQ